MTSQTLREARKYEETVEKSIAREERPDFHLCSRVGWMNDPNGFSYHNGMYHMFYQYYPYESKWGPMHWGHAVSRDLLHWEHLPAALAPDEPYDRDGCFSGSALTLPDGRQLLMYTSVVKERQENDTIRDIQTQSLAIGDGITPAPPPLWHTMKSMKKILYLTRQSFPSVEVSLIFGTRRYGRMRTARTVALRETVWQTETGGFCCSPAKMVSNGSFAVYWCPMITVLEKCGSVPISLGWMGSGYCLPARRIC